MVRERYIRLLVAALVACVALMFTGCGSSAPVAGEDVAPTGAVFEMPAAPAMPEVSADAPSIDVSHVNDGYVVAHLSSAARLKFQVVHDRGTYNYDLPNNDTPTVFPINMGDGAYRFRIMKNTDGNNYAEAESVEADVSLTNEFAPFLIPNQYCDYRPDSACITKARELAEGASMQAEAVQRVCDFIVETIEYDNGKAEALSAKTGYIPNPDTTLADGSGVCFDYASLGAAMLRSLGIPTQIITGNVSPGDLYHAWIMVYVDGTWREGTLEVRPNEWSRLDLTFAAADGAPNAGDGTTYTDRYLY